jgi:nitrate reductase delta subunit
MNAGYRALAALLDYPSAELLEHLDEIETALADLDAQAAGAVRPLLAELARADLLDLQENYIETFDRGRRTSLNLFEHVHGDSRDRGQAMVDLLAMYERAGVQFNGDQLPDYLPAFLEFLALLPAEQGREQLGEIAHILGAIDAALRRRRSAYATVLGLLLELAGAAPAAAVPGAHDDDTTPAAIDAAWAEAPVNFLDAPAPCSAPPPSTPQPIHLHRRAA